ncbi:MAG: hypothetical protein GYB20_20140 [Oceanospirillales bacterium]|nr:hypothetical protein [Oceanospirillales bacterium]
MKFIHVKNSAAQLSGPRFLTAPKVSEGALCKLDIPDDSTPTKNVESSVAQVLDESEKESSPSILKRLRCVRDQGSVYLLVDQGGHLEAVLLNSKKGLLFLRQLAKRLGQKLSKAELNDLLEMLEGNVDAYAPLAPVHHRVAPIQGGIELYLGDPNSNRIEVTKNGVVNLGCGSETLFRASPLMAALPLPADKGDYKRLATLLNINELNFALLVGWITYTIATPKTEGGKYVHLVVSGDQGTGKSSLCNILLSLIDPSMVGIQAMPGKVDDIALILKSSHVACFDNVRYFSATMSDYLCMASTGGAISNRQLYTDSDVSIKKLHGACVLNGIYSFISQPDLAQRCLTITTRKMEYKERRTEVELLQEFELSRPAIFRGLLDLISDVYKHLPDIVVEQPERMVEFSRWLAAMEKAEGVPEGVYQGVYSSNLKDAQLDGLMENALGAALIEFSADLSGDKWTGSPAELLAELNESVSKSTTYSKSWPKSAIALGKRLQGIKAALSEQGVHIESTRGKRRTVMISVER